MNNPIILKAKHGKQKFQIPVLNVNLWTGHEAALKGWITICLTFIDRNPEERLDYYLYPEDRVHPHNQSRKLVPIMCHAREYSRIVIVTQSDHIFNGIRLLLRRGELNPEDLQVIYFDEQQQPRPIEMDQRGHANYYPDGFFDQQIKDLTELV